MDFIGASRITDQLSPHKLGGPFYISVPSGRANRYNMNDDDDNRFEDDKEFVAASAFVAKSQYQSILGPLALEQFGCVDSWREEFTNATDAMSPRLSHCSKQSTFQPRDGSNSKQATERA